MNYDPQPFLSVVPPPASTHFMISSCPPPPYPSHVFPASQFVPFGNNQVPPHRRQVFTPPPTQLLPWGGHLPPPPPLSMPPLHMSPMHAVKPMPSLVTYNNNPMFSPPTLQMEPEMHRRHVKCKVEKNSDWESIFRNAASRNGIKVEDSPKPGKSTNIVSEHKKVQHSHKQAKHDIQPSFSRCDRIISMSSTENVSFSSDFNVENIFPSCEEGSVVPSLKSKLPTSSNQFPTIKEPGIQPFYDHADCNGNDKIMLKDTALVVEEPSDHNYSTSIPKNVSLDSPEIGLIYVSDNEFESEASEPENCGRTSSGSSHDFKEVRLAVEREFSSASDLSTQSDQLSEFGLELEVEIFVNDIVTAAVESLMCERKERESDIERESSILQHSLSHAETESDSEFKMWLNMYDCMMNSASDVQSDSDDVKSTKLTSDKASKEEYRDGRPCSLEDINFAHKAETIPDTPKEIDEPETFVLDVPPVPKLTSDKESTEEYSDGRICSLEGIHCLNDTKMIPHSKEENEDYYIPHSFLLHPLEDKTQGSVCAEACEHTWTSNEDNNSFLSKIDNNATTELNIDCQPFVPKSSSSSEEEDVEDSFVKLALQKGIKVGKLLPANNNCADTVESKPGVEFEKLALKSGIRIGGSHPKEHPQMPKEKESKSERKDIYDEIFEKYASKNGIKIGSGGNQQDLASSLNEPEDPVCIIPVERPYNLYYNTVIPCIQTYNSPKSSAEHYVVQNGSDGASKAHRSRSFEEIAKKHGIKIGIKTIVHAQCQTVKPTVHSQESQTFDLVKVKCASVQVDVDQEAFKQEFHVWMQEELHLLDSTAASFRELYCSEVDACTEAERRLALEMDENVKSQRNAKMVIDELKEKLQEKEDIIEKLNKELKTTKKQKDNEIKRLNKDIKQKQEDIDSIKHENKLKDVAIENINEMSRDQTGRIEELQERLQEVERAMEDEKKKNSELLKFEPPQKPLYETSAWQVVKHGTSKTRALETFPHHVDSLSAFDNEEFAMYGTRKNSSGSIESDSQESVHCSEVNNHRHSSAEGVTLSKSQHQSTENMGNITNSCNRSESNLDISTEMNRITPSWSSITSSQPSQREPLIRAVSQTETVLPSSRTNSHESSTTLNSHACPVGATIHPSGVPPVPSGPGISVGQPVLPGPNPSTRLPTRPPNLYSGYDALLSSTVATGLQTAAMGSCVKTFPTTCANDQPSSRSTPLGSTKAYRKTSNKFSTFDKLMEALRDQLPSYTRPELMVFLKKAKESFGTNGFKGKEISEIVVRVSQIVNPS